MIDPYLRQYAATDRQREVFDAVVIHTTNRAAADALGVGFGVVAKIMSKIRKRAARDGRAPGHFDSGTAPGYTMGKVTIQRNGEGAVTQSWERQAPDDESAEALLIDALERLADGVRGGADPIEPPEFDTETAITAYPMGDPHCGMRAWAAETGADFDLNIFEGRLKGAIDRLVAAAPATRDALFINLGDFFHSDSSANTTTRGTPVDVDGRATKIGNVALRCMIYAIDKLRAKHERVTVWNKPGNHDANAWRYLAAALNAYYHADSRVDVPVDPCKFSYMKFGKCLFASTHGDGLKIENLSMIMATDRKEDWGSTEHRTWFIGHFHHKQVIKDLTGCTVEIARTLAGTDKWHHDSGYRSKGDMQAIVFDAEHGEVERHTCGVSML